MSSPLSEAEVGTILSDGMGAAGGGIGGGGTAPHRNMAPPRSVMRGRNGVAKPRVTWPSQTSNGLRSSKPVADALRSCLTVPHTDPTDPRSHCSQNGSPSPTDTRDGQTGRSTVWRTVQGWVPGDTTWEIVSWLAVALTVVVWYREVLLYELGTKGLWASSNGACHQLVLSPPHPPHLSVLALRTESRVSTDSHHHLLFLFRLRRMSAFVGALACTWSITPTHGVKIVQIRLQPHS